MIPLPKPFLIFLAIIGIYAIFKLIIGHKRVSMKRIASELRPDIPVQKELPKYKGSNISTWILPIIILLVVSIVLGLVGLHYKKGWKEKTVSRSAFYSWKKLDHQYGYDPKQRSAGPLKTKITKYTDKSLSFTVYSQKGEGYFEGWKVGKNEFEGRWRCPSAGSGGKWKLKKVSEDPETYVGVETDPSLPSLEDGKPSELIILD